MNETNTQNARQQSTTPTPEDRGGQGEGRTFTQEEVNRIVADRLAREKAKAGPSPADERERALKARETRLDCRDYLDAKGYPAALLEVLDGLDTARFKATVEKLVKLFPVIVGGIRREGFIPGERTAHYAGADPIAAAFKPKI